MGSKSINSAKLLSIAGESNGLFEAPRQFVIPNFVLQEIMSEIKLSYLD